MITATATTARHDLSELLDALDDGEHVQITKRSQRTGMLVPGEWYEEAERALALVRGLAQLGTAGTDVQNFVEAVMSEVATGQQPGLFNSGEVMAKAS